MGGGPRVGGGSGGGGAGGGAVWGGDVGGGEVGFGDEAPALVVGGVETAGVDVFVFTVDGVLPP